MEQSRPSFRNVSPGRVLQSVIRIYYGNRRMLAILAAASIGLERLLRWQVGLRKKQRKIFHSRSLTNVAGATSKTHTGSAEDAQALGNIDKRRASVEDLRASSKQSSSSKQSVSGAMPAKKKAAAVRVDGVFLRRLMRLFPILVPGWTSKESLLIVSETFMLVARSLLSLHISELTGKGLQAVARRSPEALVVNLCDFFISGVFASVANSALKYMGNLMSTWFRENLTREVHRKYMSNSNYYQAAVMMQAGSQQNRLDNVDQRIVSDLHNFTKMLADLYSRTFKPALDVILCTRAMAVSLSMKGPLMMYGYFIVTTFFLRVVSPPLARLTAQQQALEGDFRHCHSRLLSHAEEVAFIAGADREEEILNEQLQHVSSFSEHLHLKQFQQGVLDSFGLKYFASCVGWPIIAVPFIIAAPGEDQIDMLGRYRIADDLIRQGSAGLAELLMVYKKLQTLSGFTARVSELVEALEAITKGSKEASANSCTVPQLIDGEAQPAVSLENVTVETPDGRLLVKDLSMELQKGDHLLVTGPNGAGKSSLFRVLGGLWPCKSGSVHGPSPAERQVLYLPQTPYLVMGSLRDQVIYPDTPSEAVAKHGNKRDADAAVRSSLTSAGMERFAQGDLDLMHREWDDVLSGGEKQRMGWARLFYHSPAFAALDEATSAVNVQQEGPLYQAAIDRNIMLLSIAHRPTVRSFHKWELNLAGDGSGNCTLAKIEPEGC